MVLVILVDVFLGTWIAMYTVIVKCYISLFLFVSKALQGPTILRKSSQSYFYTLKAVLPSISSTLYARVFRMNGIFSSDMYAAETTYVRKIRT